MTIWAIKQRYMGTTCESRVMMPPMKRIMRRRIAADANVIRGPPISCVVLWLLLRDVKSRESRQVLWKRRRCLRVLPKHHLCFRKSAERRRVETKPKQLSSSRPTLEEHRLVFQRDFPPISTITTSLGGKALAINLTIRHDCFTSQLLPHGTNTHPLEAPANSQIPEDDATFSRDSVYLSRSRKHKLDKSFQ